jgi:hypothetical protein
MSGADFHQVVKKIQENSILDFLVTSSLPLKLLQLLVTGLCKIQLAFGGGCGELVSTSNTACGGNSSTV